MIIHIDMDAFYASVEEREDPRLRGKPVIVGGSPQARGVVAAANYEARRYGVHSAMPSARAHRLCPHAIFLPSRVDFYAEVSRQIHTILERYTPTIEPLSLDEAFLDTAGSESLFGPPSRIARRIKDDITRDLHLVSSLGVAPTKFVAKLASEIDKPDGFVVVPPEEVRAFLGPLPVGCLWGVGRASGEIFRALGVTTIGEVASLPLETLRAHFGKQGDHLLELARGVDPRRVVPDAEAKSISHETTFTVDESDEDLLRAHLLGLTEQIGRRIRRLRRAARTVQIKIRFADFTTHTRAKSLAQPTHVTREIWTLASGLLAASRRQSPRPLRLLGVGVSGLCPLGPEQQDLFDGRAHQRQGEIDSLMDAVAERYGAASLRRGSTL